MLKVMKDSSIRRSKDKLEVEKLHIKIKLIKHGNAKVKHVKQKGGKYYDKIYV